MGGDPYRYFRVEAREILEGMTAEVLALDQDAAGEVLAARIAKLMRLAHTLKGAARVVKAIPVGEMAHAMEGILAPHRDSREQLTREAIDELLRLIDGIAKHLAAIDAPATVAPASAARPAARTDAVDPFQTVRVDVGEMDALMNEIATVTIRLSGLRRSALALAPVERIASSLLEQISRRRVAPTGRARRIAEELLESIQRSQRDLLVGLERTEAGLRQVRAKADRVRLVPVRAVFGLLERAARDAARSLGKEIVFDAAAGDIRVEGHLLWSLRDALLHAVRNAVDHGIEAPDRRAAAGKPPAGRITVRARRDGNRLVMTCADDGRGLDVDRILRSAVTRGLLSDEKARALSMDDAIRLVFQGGLSTADTVTEVSGRGVGLDVVRETASRFRGDVGLASQPGHGTTLTINVPMSLSSLPALLLESGGVVACLPLDSVSRALWTAESEVLRSPERDSILYEGRAIPFAPLSGILTRPAADEHGRASRAAVVVRSGQNLAAVAVDRLLGTSEIVVRPLPSGTGDLPLLAGASLDAEGNPRLVLDPDGVVAAARGLTGRAAERAVSQSSSVLVIDDSLTTRMLEQSILESAGYEVDLATSGEEALSKARRRRYDLFIVDVEMPGMNGFEFIGRARSESALARTPAILLTSRSSTEERRRGVEVGAKAFIVKSEFDQERFLHTIKELTG